MRAGAALLVTWIGLHRVRELFRMCRPIFGGVVDADTTLDLGEDAPVVAVGRVEKLSV